jgi:phage repressor protein C with HTH and peptisase S24 domain
MARRKTLPESVRTKLDLAERLAALRLDLYGERGGPEMARRLGIPVRTWYNYEGGVTVPAEVILKIIELTSVEPAWLLRGEGPRLRPTRTERAEPPAVTVGSLLRTALQLLENEEPTSRDREGNPIEFSHDNGLAIGENMLGTPQDSSMPVHGSQYADELGGDGGSRFSQSRREWLAAHRDNRCLQVSGDSMAPIVADGASIAYASEEDDLRELDGKMVIAWLENEPVVRWFQYCGRYALLRAENPKTVPQQILVDLEDPRQGLRFRRVLWINTPH